MNFNFFVHKFDKYTGYGRMGMKLMQSCELQGDIVHPGSYDIFKSPQWIQRRMGIDYSKDTLMLMQGEFLESIPGRLVSFTMWETTKLPDGWIDKINNHCRYLIVPCQHNKELFLEEGVTIPIEIVQGGIDPSECPLIMPPNGDTFNFTCLGDRGGRKGHDLAYMAFYRAFGDNPDVRFIIKSRPGSLPPISYDSDFRVSAWSEDLDIFSDCLYNTHCFVFPTFGEGYGMPPREAAACGIPVLATRWSGTADNLDEWAIPLNKFNLVKSRFMPGNGDWSFCDIDEIAEKMLWVFNNYKEAKENALKSREWLLKNQTYDIAAKKLMQVMENYR